MLIGLACGLAQVLLPASAVAAASAAPRTLQQLHPEHAMMLPGQYRNLQAIQQWQQQQQRAAAAAEATAAASSAAAAAAASTAPAPEADATATLSLLRPPASAEGAMRMLGSFGVHPPAKVMHGWRKRGGMKYIYASDLRAGNI